MSKRPVEELEDGNQAYLKRQKISNNPTYTPVPDTDEIRSARKLRQILAFDQDAVRSKHAIQSFKTFLDSIANAENPDPGRLSILKEYLESQKPSEDEEKDSIYLGELIKTWSLAAQSNDDSILSAVPAVLALLLRTISTILDLSEFGLRLGRTLLQKPQLDLIARGLTANKSREFVISPALRLLRELVIFDGGTLAKQVFRARDQTLRGVVRNLNIRYTGDGVEDRRKPSVRTNALRLILPLLKFLPPDGKRDLLNQRDLVSALTWEIKEDPSFMVREILEVLKLSILQDEALPRESKTKVVNSTSLQRISTLYGYDHVDEEASASKKPINTEAHDFLLLACTTPDLGVLTRQSGLYPRGIDPDDTHNMDGEQSFIDLGIDSIEWMDSFNESVPVRNTILADFMQNLRPWSSTKQRELILSVFKSAPELIGDYFLRKKSFYFDPKLSATWMGYAAFVFSSIQLPIPKYFGHQGGYARLPPPTSIVMNNILPQALDQKVLTRCLGQPQTLITFFTIRLLCIALAKLQTILKMYQEASEGTSSIWSQAAERLTVEFCQRCPSIKLVISRFQKLENTDLMQREAVTRLIVLYYEVIPRVALDAKFDVSATLAEMLLTMDETATTPEERTLRSMELENLFQWAQFSPGMRWFTQVEGLTISPIIAMLKLCAAAPPDIPLVKLRSVLGSIVQENQILQATTAISALDCLILRLREVRGPNAAAVYSFIDDCISRCALKSVKYIFLQEEIQAEAHKSADKQAPLSLLTLVISEQWPFVVKSSTEDELLEISEFVASYLAGSIKIKEDKKALKALTKKIASATPANSPACKVIEGSKKQVDSVTVPDPKPIAEVVKHATKNNAPSETAKEKVLENLLEASDVKDEDHSALVKWTTKEVDEVIEAGHAAALIRLLSSEHLSVRKEAAINLSKFSAKLKESNFEEKEQMWLLFAEVVETAKKVIDKEPLPSIISSFASHAIAVLNDPLHCLYPKINKFLSQGPTWEVEKIPLMYKILDDAPSLDDAHYLEISWLLNYMHSGLRTAADMSIFRKRRVFEKLFSLYNNTYLAPGLRDKILKILFRASTIEGGSTTLVTRFSTVTWLQAQVALGGGVTLKVLTERIMESCDEKRVGIWSKQGAGKAKVNTMKI